MIRVEQIIMYLKQNSTGVFERYETVILNTIVSINTCMQLVEDRNKVWIM